MKHKLSIAILLIISLIGAGCRGVMVLQHSNPISTPSAQDHNSPSAVAEPDLFPIEIGRKLRFMLREEVRDNPIPGIVFYVATSNGVWMDAEGSANQELKVRMQPTDRFRIGGMTTLFISVICLQLVEEGILNLDTPISNYLPQEISDRLPNSDRIRLRRLLSQTSGLAEVYTEEFLAAVQANPQREWTAQEVLEYAYDTEPVSLRGSYHYSSTNYLVLEIILEQVTGKPLAQLMQQRIQAPLNLTNTFLELKQPIPGGFTQGYQDWNDDGTAENVTKPQINNGLGLGHSGIVSNATDLVRLFRALFAEGKLLYPTTLEENMLDRVPAGMGDGFGLGIAHFSTRWGEAWGHRGRTLGFQSVVLYFPVHDLTLIVWTNTGDRRAVNPMEVAENGLSIILGEPNSY